jgi:hypothetical protein
VLASLTSTTRITSRLRGLLRWQQNLSPKALAGELCATEEEVSAGLALLGTSGLVGYDLAAGAYFHRELPFDLSRIPDLHPRLADARAIVNSDNVELDAEGAWVRGRGAEYRVRRDAAGAWRCSCPWTGRHGLSRGPCKHILAVKIAAGEETP